MHMLECIWQSQGIRKTWCIDHSAPGDGKEQESDTEASDFK